MSQTTDKELQRKLRAVDRSLRGFELADLESVLKTSAGRRFYYRLVYELGNLEGTTFDPAIKDGNCLSLLSAHGDGVRAVARVLKNEAIENFPELWLMLTDERNKKARSDAIKREELLRNSGDNDD